MLSQEQHPPPFAFYRFHFSIILSFPIGNLSGSGDSNLQSCCVGMWLGWELRCGGSLRISREGEIATTQSVGECGEIITDLVRGGQKLLLTICSDLVRLILLLFIPMKDVILIFM